MYSSLKPLAGSLVTFRAIMRIKITNVDSGNFFVPLG